MVNRQVGISMERISIQEGLIKDKNWIIGPSIVRCSKKNAPGYGSLLMIATLSDGSDSGAVTAQWRSEDGGKTFTRERDMEYSYVCDGNGSRIKIGDGSLYADEEHDVILYIGNDAFWEKNAFESTKRCYLPYYRLSYDNGYSWTEKKFIITEGMTPQNPIPDVVYGRNMTLSCQPVIIRSADGALLVGIHTQIVNENGRLVEPSGFHFFKAGALRGVWNGNGYSWSFGQYVSVAADISSRGVFEPMFVRRKGNGVMMIMRSSNSRFTDTMIPCKYYALSDDNGITWSQAMPLLYDDGTVMYSSSSILKPLVHSNGKVYISCVITERNAVDGNLPRYPLCIAELDTDSCTVLRSSVRIIDTKRAEYADYTNHCIFEEPDTGKIIVLAPFWLHGPGSDMILNRYELSP